MGTVNMWLSVYEKKWMGTYVLWFKKLITDFAPRTGDKIDLHEDGCSWHVDGHWWNQDGSYDIHLRDMVVDPELGDDRSTDNYTLWSDGYGERPEPMLRENGWMIIEEQGTREGEKIGDTLPLLPPEYGAG